MQNAAETVCAHLADSFMEWIGWPAHFNAVPLPLEEGWHLALVAQERCRQHSRIQDVPNQPAHLVRQTSSGSSLQLVGRAPPTPENQEGATTLAEPPRPSLGRLHCHPQDWGSWGMEVEVHCLPLQNAWVELTQMVNPPWVNQMESIGAGGTKGQRED